MKTLNAAKYNFDFVAMRKITLGLSALLILVIFAFWLIKGMNLGIDFKGGTSIVMRMPEKADVADIREKVSKLGLGEFSVQEFGSPQDVLLKFQASSKDVHEDQILGIKKALGDRVEYRQIDKVGPKFGGELVYSSVIAVVLALIGILLYVWVRFSWQLAVCGTAALIHDCIAILGLYCLFPNFEFNVTAIVAILTTAGYSINDTVVIYDRIRENMDKLKKKELKFSSLINLSVNETLSRTVLTSGSTLLSLVALFVLGGVVVQNFVLPIIIGVIAGTYSSIFVASALVSYFDINVGHGKLKQVKERKNFSPFGDI